MRVSSTFCTIHCKSSSPLDSGHGSEKLALLMEPKTSALCSFAETGMAKCLVRPDTFRSRTLLRVAPIVLRRVQHPPACCDIPNPTRNQTNGYGSTACDPQAHREMTIPPVDQCTRGTNFPADKIDVHASNLPRSRRIVSASSQSFKSLPSTRPRSSYSL